MSDVPLEYVKIALERVEGFDFERFVQQFFSALLGQEFVPLGGLRDGGADAVISESVFEQPGNASLFIQASVRVDYERKIEETIARLREVGRAPRTLYYTTSRVIPRIDQVEDRLSARLSTTVKIRDFNYIVNHINDSPGTGAAFREHLVKYTEFLRAVGATRLIAPSADIEDPAAYVFLEQEAANRLGNASLLQTITDSLILWALNGTDPDRGLFMTREEVLNKIVSTLPWAKQFVRGQLDQRIEVLAAKANATGREVRWHRREDKFCLPFETRDIVARENAADEGLRIDVMNEIVISLGDACSLTDAETIARVCLRTVELFFQREGLAMSYFVSGRDPQQASPNTMSDRIEEALTALAVPASSVGLVRENAAECLRRMFYGSTARQRDFLIALSRTYLLLFSLKADPRVIEYFQGMTRHFHLLVGTDVLLLALTERYVPTGDQRARNMLKLARAIGTRLILTEPILEELYTHLRATDYEFQNHYADIEPYVDHLLASQSDRILIRTYFYARAGRAVSGWKKFVSQFASWDRLHSGAGKEEFRDYLVSAFGLEFISKEELLAVCDVEQVRRLASTFLQNGIKDKEELAFNDALSVHAVYGLRKRNREAQQGPLEFGYLTWWLTRETRIQRFTADLVRHNGGARYIMRPEFLLNYFSLCPSREEVLTTYRNVFPTTLGLQMGHRLREDALHEILGIVGEWKNLEPGRRTAKMKALSDRLKTDHLRIAEFRLEPYRALRDRE
jgi:hypothetical protein